MRALALVSASVLAALACSGAAHAQELCLYGGPDAAADLACGPAYVAPMRPMPVWSGRAAESRAEGVSVSRTTGAAESRILSGGRVTPAQPALPYGYEYEFTGPAPGLRRADPATPERSSSFAEARAASAAQAGTYAYAYESADGAAWAWRQDTPEGPAWAYAYDTPQGRAWAWAGDAAGAPPPAPPAPIEVYPGHDAWRGPARHYEDWRYSETRLYGASYPRQLYLVETYYRDTGWVTVDAVPLGTRISCGACGVPPYAWGGTYGGYSGYGAAPRGGVYSGGGYGMSGFGPSGFMSGGSYLVGGRGGDEAFASQRFSESNTARMTNEAFASARGNQNVIAGAPFAPPAGAPAPPWGPPPQMGMTGPNAASASAGANAGARARF